VVLFDEIEKAHPDVFNTLLQILDDGRLTDGQGRTVNFRNTVIIMTSNVGSSEIRDSAPIGFSINAKHAGNEDTRKLLLEALRRTFRPEFLNRVDDIIVFNPLNKEHLTLIIDIQLERVSKLLATKGIHLEVTQSAKDVLMAEGYDPAYGARPMRRAIQRLIQDPLSLRLLSGDFTQGDTVVAEGNAEKHELEFTRRVAETVTQ
jgi:ATP-dependent Clp protease ATP-binding subunit ClpA